MTDLSPAAAAVLALADAGHLVLFNPWIGTASTAESIDRPHVAVDLAAVDELLAAGALDILRSSGSVFVCVPPDGEDRPLARVAACYGLPERYRNCVHRDAKA